MNIITENDVIYSNAKGDRKEKRQEKKAVRKAEKEVKKATRKEEGGFFKRLSGKLKAKKNARKLRKEQKNGKTVYKDTVPPVVNGTKTLPDGSTESVPTSDIKDIGGISVDKKDINNASSVAVEAGKVVAEIAEENVVSVLDEAGQEVSYKKSDVDGGLSTIAWVGIGVGTVAFVGLLTYLIIRKKK
jgi:hypothetical protein